MGYEFLKHFIKEPIYLIDESGQPEDEDSEVMEDQDSVNEPPLPILKQKKL